MWKLNSVEAGGETYYLLPGKQYIVGRKNCEILLQNDQSISRVHAHLAICAQNSNQNEPAAFTVTDSSKYGTFVNEERLANGAPKTLHSGDKIAFGVFHSKFRVEYEPLVVCSSCVDNKGKAELSQTVQLLGGQLINSWTLDCTHLVMSSVKVTIKTISALTCCRPIVRPEYFSELVKALQEKRPPPKFESFYPEIDEPSLNKDDVDLNARPERKRLFEGKTFIFLNAKQQKRLSSVVAFGGGQSQLLEEGSLPLSILESPGSCVIDMGTSNSQPVLPASTKWCESVAGALHRKGLRIIAESEIGLATIYASTEKYCNPLSKLESETVRRKPSIPGATLSQSVANETVLPAMSQNVTAFAPNTEPSQGASSLCRMGTSGLSAVGETPEKQQGLHRPLGKGAAVNDPPFTFTVAGTVPSVCSATSVMDSEADAVKPALASRQKRDSSATARPLLANGDNSRPSERSSNPLTNYFQPSSKKRTREGTDPDDFLEAKTPRRDAEKDVPQQRDSAVQYSEPQTQVPRRAPMPKPDLKTPAHRGDGESQKPNLDSPKRSPENDATGNVVGSNKRKEMAAPDPLEDMEDLESIMSTPMEEEEVPVAPSKKQRLDPEIKEEESFAETSKPEEGMTSKGQREDQLENAHGTEQAKVPTSSVKAENGEDLPKNLVLVEFKSLVVSAPVRARPGALQPRDTNQKNFKKFRKAPVPGAQGLPNIIGGSDLIAHNRAKNSELEEWLREAALDDQRNEKEEALGDDLFRYNPKPSKRK
ncbi:hypothetical protein GJAV_G00020540 [Gymnothorax javanicus]|nr:hypothetical protein GJAV_G00020540 [Gymnothorax javanicus]